MPAPPGCPDTLRIPGTGLSTTASSPINNKPSSIPAFPIRISQQVRNIEVQLPPLIAGALTAAFARALADGLSNELMAHYYIPEQRVRINLDRVVDRLLSKFVKRLWDDLAHFYHQEASGASARQVTLLFDGPVRQLVLILNGPETARCILDKLGPGLSRRPLTWSTHTKGIELPLALQLLCGYWHREFASQSPGGSPDEIARTLHTIITTGSASRKLVSDIRRLLLSPHYVQMHLAESAIWDITLKRPGRPPQDGFHIVQFKFACELLHLGEGTENDDFQRCSLGALPVTTGTAAEFVETTVAEYVDKQWPKCGRIVLNCLEEAARNAADAYRQGEGYYGMSVWDGSDRKGSFCPGLRLIHIEVEGSFVRMSVSAWIHTMIDVFQQMSWSCAALSSSPFLGTVAECAAEVSNWVYMDDSIYVDCTLNHRAVSEEEAVHISWQRRLQGVSMASGFPVDMGSLPLAASSTSST